MPLTDRNRIIKHRVARASGPALAEQLVSSCTNQEALQGINPLRVGAAGTLAVKTNFAGALSFSLSFAMRAVSNTALVEERLRPSEHAEGRAVDAPWDALDRAYFDGYTLWTYLTTPFHFGMPGFDVEEIAPWHERDELWRGLRVTYPTDIASHSRQKDFYFGSDFLLRRHDYHVEASGEFAAAQYVFDPVTVQGITLPTKRRAYMRDQSFLPIRDRLMVLIDISDVFFL